METKHTKLTRFLCQELLYEYACGNLDEVRKRDMDEYLQTCHDSRRELENLRKGLTYCESVTQISISPSLRQGLLGFEPAWKKRLQAWTLWSSQRGWRMVPYVFIVLAVALGLVVTQPWRDHRRPDLILAEEKAPEQKSNESALPTKLATATDVNVASAAGSAPAEAPSLAAAPSVMQPVVQPQPETPTAAQPVTGASLPATETATLPPAQTVAAAPAPTTPPAPATKDSARKSIAQAKAAEAAADDKKSDEVVRGSGKGELMRGEIAVGDFGAASPAIRDKIISLGGKAAGSVELGWLRRPNEAYFHFSLPESNYEDLETFLKTFGPVQIKKERHPRVMPEGQIRIILTVKDGGESNEGEAEAP